MTGRNRIAKVNNYVVYPVLKWNPGSISIGIILH